MYTRENGQIWVNGPQLKEASAKGVWVYPGEDVEWHYTCTPFGTLVTGYTIKPSRVESKDEGENL